MEPPIRTVRASQPLLEFGRFACRQRALMGSDERRQIVWMHDIAGLPLPGIGQRPPVVLPSEPVFQFQLTRRVVDCDVGWNVVDNRAELALARSRQIFSTFPILNVDVGTAPTGDGAGTITERLGAEQEPPILAVEASQARFDLTRRTRGENGLPVRQSGG